MTTRHTSHTLTTAPLVQLLLLVSIFFCAPAPARAHESLDKRVVTAQISQERISLLLYYKMAPGEASQALHLRYDTDHSGQIDTPTEINRFGRVMLPIALAHLSFEVLGERPGALEPSLKFRLLEDGSLEMMVLMEYELPPLTAGSGAERTLRIGLSSDPHALETGVEFQAISPLSPHTIDRKPLQPGDAHRLALEPGHHHDLTALYNEPKKASPKEK